MFVRNYDAMLTGEGCFSDVSSYNDFPPSICSRLEDLCLEVRRHLGVDGQYREGSWIIQLREALYIGVNE